MLVIGLLLNCDAFTSVQGEVRDGEGHPLVGASVMLVATKSGKTSNRTTGADGTFSVTRSHGILSGSFRLEVSKNGYVTFTKEIRAKSQEQIIVTLLPESGKPQH
jgi:hypothetical protein